MPCRTSQRRAPTATSAGAADPPSAERIGRRGGPGGPGRAAAAVLAAAGSVVPVSVGSGVGRPTTCRWSCGCAASWTGARWRLRCARCWSGTRGCAPACVVSDGQPWQVIDPPPAEWTLPVLELPAIGWQDGVVAEISRPFRLLDEPGFRCCLGRLADDDHVLILNFHHIISDGWSLGIVAADLGQAYHAVVRGEPAELPRLAVQPADYAHWQREHRDQLDAGLAFWAEQLADLPTIALPTDRPRPAAPTGAGAGLSAVVEPAVAAGVRRAGRPAPGQPAGGAAGRPTAPCCTATPVRPTCRSARCSPAAPEPSSSRWSASSPAPSYCAPGSTAIRA